MEWMRERYRRWRHAHPRTTDEVLAALRIAENGDQILLYEGDGDSWFPHQNGVAIVKGRKLLLNGRETLFEADAGSRFTSYARHPKGFLVVHYAMGNPQKLVLNGETVLHEGRHDEFHGSHEGILLRYGQQFVLAGTAKMLYEGHYSEWGPHSEGVIIRMSSIVLRLNGERLLYQGPMDSWRSHPQGFVIEKKGALFLNGQELMYDGPYDDWSSHDHGVLIRRHKRLLLVVHKTFDADRIIV